jgi:hypothetical protein
MEKVTGTPIGTVLDEGTIVVVETTCAKAGAAAPPVIIAATRQNVCNPENLLRYRCRPQNRHLKIILPPSIRQL